MGINLSGKTSGTYNYNLVISYYNTTRYLGEFATAPFTLTITDKCESTTITLASLADMTIPVGASAASS